jgi:hypothetical protein
MSTVVTLQAGDRRKYPNQVPFGEPIYALANFSYVTGDLVT